ncbi:hypothetical protein D3C76_405720 [compost metagenome]
MERLLPLAKNTERSRLACSNERRSPVRPDSPGLKLQGTVPMFTLSARFCWKKLSNRPLGANSREKSPAATSFCVPAAKG